MYQATERVRNIEYAIRDVIVYAKREEEKGKKVIYLNIGDPVKFDFDTPSHIKEALIRAVKDGYNWYSSSEGIPELRDAICEKEKRVNGVTIAPDDVLVTGGVSEAINVIMAASVDKGDEVLVPGPCYPPYVSFAKFFGGTPISYRTIEENGWQPDINDVRSKVTDRTKGIVVINPNNPTGSLYDEKILREMVELAGEHNLLLISDEIYDRIVYEKKFVSLAHIAKDVPVLGLNGFSKAYLMTGWRLGYVYFHDSQEKLSDMKENVEKEARIRLCCNTPVQKAAVEALRGPQDHIEEMVGELRRRRDYSWKRLNEIEGISCAKPEGAFYVFPKIHGVGSRWRDDFDFVRQALEKTQVLLVHGSGFCVTYGTGHFRGAFLPPVEVLETAFDRLERFMTSHD
ncbi:MAG: aminotransferase class I/II-fold pyridoxal phosphate-dependent enzyme [Candidatus Bathyarchaeota archaeon]|nr:MAG: aminotransferase class I/II-fold pyridoxal phosphate-dependent enzyme [Candidatus Bathyarchaeota archaeon]